MSEKIKVTIGRSKWRTGYDGLCRTGLGRTQLRNKEGFQCCLGFCVKAANSRLTITGCSEPEDLKQPVPGLTEAARDISSGRYENTTLALRAMEINDDELLPQAERERKLLKLFKRSPFELKFVGEYKYVGDACDNK